MNDPSIQIYIPTLGRTGMNKQVTLREFLEYSSYKPILICPPGEYAIHRTYYNRVLSCHKKGIGPTRQWILDHSSADIVFMVDDDMRFSYRPDPKEIKLERCTELDPMVELVIKTVWEDGFIHGGIGARQGNNRKDMQTKRKGELSGGHLIQDCERVNNVHFMNRKLVNDLGARMDQLTVMEDFHFTLTLLTKGFPNRVIHDYVWNQEGSGKTGGCSLYRTPEVQEQGANGLHEAFPEFVKVVTKVSKDSSPSWKSFKERKDVIIQWLKAARKGGIEL